MARSDLNAKVPTGGTGFDRSDDVKYMLMMYMNPATWESLSEDDRNAVFKGHEDFMKLINSSGEMVHTKALADVSTAATVRVREGVPAATDGPYLEAKEFMCGYYLVDVETRERAIELAAMIPDAKYTAVEVHQVVHEIGPEL